MRRTRLYLIIAFQCILTSLAGQDLSGMQHKLLTAEDGLPSEYYYTVFQDSKGFLWMTTGESVLVRYDGHSYDKITYDPTDTIEHSQYTNIMAMHEDDDGVIWFGMLNGFFKYDPRESQSYIKTCYFTPAGLYFPSAVWDIFEYDDDYFWLATSNGNNLQVFNRKTGTFSRKQLEPGDQREMNTYDLAIKKIIRDPGGTIWIATVQGLYKYNQNMDSFTRFLPLQTTRWRGENSLQDLAIAGPHTLWIASYKGLFLFDTESETFDLQFIEPNEPPFIPHQFRISALTPDQSGSIWFRSRRALYRIVQENDTYYFKREFAYSTSDILSSTNSLIFEKNGNIILPVDPASIHVFSSGEKPYRTLIPESDKPPELHNATNSILEAGNGDLWLGTFNQGLRQYDPTTGELTEYHHFQDRSGSLSSEAIQYLYEDKEGTIWVGTHDGLDRIIRAADGSIRFRSYHHNPNDPSTLKAEAVFMIFEDSAGQLWVLNGELTELENSWNSPVSLYLSAYNREEDNFSHLELIADTLNIIPGHTVNAADEMWIPRNNGLLRIIPPFTPMDEFRLKASRIILYQHGPKPEENIAFDYLNPCPVLHTGSDTIWFGSYYGLGRMILDAGAKDPAKRIRYKYYNKDDGIAGSIITGLIKDHTGNIWLTSRNNTLTRFNPDIELATSIKFPQSFAVREYDGTRIFRDRSGMLLYTNRGGVHKIDPDKVFPSDKASPVYITHLKIDDKIVTSGAGNVLKDEISNVRSIKLRYNQNNLEFEFAQPDYRDPGKVTYRYKMEGLQHDWINIGNYHHANFTDIEPGEYTLRVQAANSIGIWNMEGVSLNLIITPPWWETLVAKTAYMLIPLILVVVYIRLRTRRLKQEKIRLESLVNKQTDELQKANAELAQQKEIVEEANEELKTQNQHILELDQMKTRFFTNISHEFRTPISLITSPVEEMLLHQKMNEKVRSNLEMIHRNGIRMLNLVNQLLDISKIDAGKLMIELSESDILRELHIMSRGFTPLAERKRINYQVDIPAGQYITLFDYDKLYKIVTNLLNNGFKFTPEKGIIRIRAEIREKGGRKNAPLLSLKIYNSGEGIPREQLDRIFDRFYQVSDPNQENTGGTGIGLSLVKELVRLQQGKISVESKPGEGVSFFVELPLGKDHLNRDEYELLTSSEITEDRLLLKARFMDTHEETTGEKGNGEMDSKKPLVLVVEDNEDVLQHILEHLQKHFTIKKATDGNKGWEQADALVPDLIITDRMMPGMNGNDLCFKLKNSESTSHIPVIMLTAKAESKDRIEGLNTGADDYITKPFNMRELISRGRNLIEQRKKLQEIYRGKLDAEPARVKVDSADERFLKKAMEIINRNMSDSEFDVNRFYPEMYMSRMQLLRKTKALLNRTPGELIRIMRLKRAARLIKQDYGNIAEIAYEVGFNNLSYFAKCFKEQFGVLPSEYN